MIIRKRHRVLLFATIVAALVVPLSFALSIETTTTPPVPARWAERANAAPVLAMQSGHTRLSTAAVTHRSTTPADEPGDGFSDGALLFATGTALLALAAAVRRAV